MADETDAAQTVDDVIIAFQKALGRAWKASEEAMKADPGIAGGTRQLFGVSQLDIELACVIDVRAGVTDKLAVKLDPPAGTPASVLRFRVEAKPVTVSESAILTLSGSIARTENEADMVLLANLLDGRSEGVPGKTVLFELSRPGLDKPVLTRRVVTDVRGQAAMTLSIADVEPAETLRLSTRARDLAAADTKIRILGRASVKDMEDANGRPLRTEWTEYAFDRPSSAPSSGGAVGDGSIGGPVFGPEI